MKLKRNAFYICKKLFLLIACLNLILTSFIALIPNASTPVIAADNSCTGQTTNNSTVSNPASSSARVGGVALDQAAKFLAQMDDIKGAYYDANLDRVVFIGKTNTTLPEFDKDDLAVAIKSLIFNKTIPRISFDFNNPDNDKMKVTTQGSIEDTRFGKVLFDADFKLKNYTQGYDENDTKVTSSISSYKSLMERYLDKTPNPVSGGFSRVWIQPNQIILKKDDTANSFVFDTVTMKIVYESLSTENDTLYNQAGTELAQDFTQNYDQYADEISAWKDTKQLGKIVGVIKWLSDNGIATDFNWARDYTPKYVATAREIDKRVVSHNYTTGGNTYSYTLRGGVTYSTANTYNSDNGTSSSLKSSSEAVNAPKENIHWTFTNGGQSYESVAVAADAFRSLGSYNTSVTDLSTNVSDDLMLNFTRSYTSFSTGQNGVGRGWSFLPAQLFDNNPVASGVLRASCSGDTYTRRYKVAFTSNMSGFESFTYWCPGSFYNPDDSVYHSKVTNALVDSTTTKFTVTLTNNTQYEFEEKTTDDTFKLTKVRDKNGNSITYNYDSTRKLTSINDDNNHTITISYNSSNWISSITDWANRTVSYTYDTQGNLLTVTDPEGGVTTYTYDTNNRLATAKNKLNQTVLQNSYNDENKVTSQISAGNVTTTSTYDNTNRKINTTDTNNRTGEIRYDTKARVTKSTDALGNYLEYTYGNELRPLTVKDKRGNTTTFTYDSNGNVLSVTDPAGKEILYEYNTKNLITKITDKRYSTSNPKITENTYDTNGNLTQTTESTRVSSYTYNTQGRLLTQTDPLNKVTTYTRDSFNNPLTITDPLNKTTTNTYDNLGRLTQQQDPNNRITSFTYDKNNNTLTKTTAAGTTTYAYDDENRLIESTPPGYPETNFTYNNSGSIATVADAKEKITTYSYDGYQNKTAKQDALNHTTQSVYDKLNRRTSMTTPLGKVTAWEYDANGNITKRIDANNLNTLYEYDVLNRLTKITYPDSTLVTYTYDNRGNVLTMVDPTGTTTYTYDIYNRLTAVTDPNNEAIAYEYDAKNNLTKITYPGNKAVNYTYNNAGRLQSVIDWNNEDTLYEYYDNGLLKRKEFPNGIISNYDYDNANLLSKLTHRKADNSIIAEFKYTRDGLGNIISTSESSGYYLPSPPEKVKHTIYSDALGSGWSDWSWSSTNNFSNTSNPQIGTNSISWTANAAWAGLYLHKSGGVNTSPYTHLTFAMRATQAGQNISLLLYDNNDNPVGNPITLGNYGGQPVAGSYKIYNIPLGDLGATNRTINGIQIQDDTGTSQPAMFIDSVALVGSKTNPAEEYVYSDSLGSGWSDLSWSSTNNFADIRQPQSGIKNISWTANAGFAGLYLNKSSGFNTDGYSDLTFALKAANPNQQVAVQLVDDTNTSIGSPKTLSAYGGNPTTDNYKTYKIPLDHLGGANRQIKGIQIQELTGKTIEPYFDGSSTGATWNGTSNNSTSTGPAARKNLIVNPSFESNDWYIADSGNTRSNDSTEQLIGTKSLKLVGTAANNRSWYTLTDGFTPVVNQQYTFSAYLKGSGTQRLWAWNGAADVYSSNITLTNTWTRYSFTFTAQSTSGLVVGFRQPNSENVTTYVDAAILEKGNATQPYFDGSSSNSSWDGTSHNSVSTGPAPRQNLIVNPSFETNEWYLADNGNTRTQDSTQHLYGTKSLKLVGTTANNRSWYTLTDGFTPVVNQVYTFSAYMKGSGKQRLWVWNGSSDIYSPEITLNSTWTRYSFTFPALSTSNVLAGFRQPYTENVTTYVDGVMLEKGTGSQEMFVDNISFKPEASPDDFEQNILAAYDDGLSSGWSNSSTSSTVSFSDTSSPYLGSQNISWQANANGTLYLNKSTGVSITPYDALVFSLKASQSGQKVKVQLRDSSNNPIGSALELDNYGGDPIAGEYKVYTIPLADLGGSNTTIKGIVLIEATGSNKPVMYVDRVGLAKQKVSYTYDDLGQILTATYPDGNVYEYTYDDVGNRLTSKFNTATTNYSYDNDNKLTAKGATSFTYDNKGNQTGRGSDVAISYNFENKIATHSATTSALNTEYIYDGKGNRLKEKVNTETTAKYVNDVSGELERVLIERNQQNNKDNYYLYGAGLIGLGEVGSSSRMYFLEDGLGNIRFTADSSGDNLKAYVYDPYGNLIEGNNTSQMLFKGEQLSNRTGLYYMRARYYDPTTATFLSKDPVEGVAMNPQTQNGYNYSINDPINNSDPSGKEYINVGVSAGVYGLGISCGALISNKGVYPYGAAGVATPGAGASVTFSKADPEPGFSLNVAGQSGAPNTLFLAGQYSYDLDRKTSSYEIGFGAPMGASLMFQQTFDQIK